MPCRSEAQPRQESADLPATPSTARPRFERRYRARVAILDAELTQYVHEPTGARHYHLEAPFEDSAFLMAFLTPAPDSSGLTHVLEHLVMCGSERFPCRRAFFAMLGRTLSTTMNAMTTEDCTAFHFATRNLADYENLLSVYVDAAFFPCLDRLDFYQEGCRVELETEGGEESAPVRRGVVLSEMRGLMSEPEQQLEQALNRSLFPCAPYRFNAGGDPRAIPALDHETLKAYHRRHYDPANAVFLSAGPWRPKWLHRRLGDLVLGRFSCREARCVPGSVSIEVPPLEGPTRSVVRYPAAGAGDRESAGAGVALGWRLGETADPMAAVRARVLARLLLESGDVPLRRALLEASGGPAVAFGSSTVQAIGRRLVFRCGVHGCDPDLAGEVEARVLAAVDGAARDGVERMHVEGALASMDRDLRERHDPRFPYPLKLLARILPVALYGGEPACALDLSAALVALRNEVRSRRDVAELVRRCLRDNPERVSVTAIPDPAAARRLDAEERAVLMRAYGPSRPRARQRVVERSRALRRRQESDSGESSLPRLGLDEVGPARERPELYALPAGSVPWRIRHRSAGTETAEAELPAEIEAPAAAESPAEMRSPTEIGSRRTVRVDRDAAVAMNGAPPAAAASGPHVRVGRGPAGGLVYARLAVDIPVFEIDRIDDVGLLAEILSESGHGVLGPAETRARLVRFCDRLEVEPRMLARAAPGPDTFDAVAPRVVLLLSARALASDEDMLLRVLSDAHFHARFDAGARVAAAKAHARRRRDLARRGHLHAERVAAARLDAWAAVAERWHGPSALAILARAAEDGNAGKALAERLHHVHRALAATPYQLQIVRDRDDGSNGESGRTPSGPAARIPAPDVHGAGRASSARHGTEPEAPEHRPPPPPPACAAPCRASVTGAWILEGPVNYCAKVYPAVASDHPDAGSLAVLAAFLGGDLLQRAVRERGGAYGAGARYCGRTCTVRMFSYRDPRLAQTLRDFDEAIEALRRHPPEGRRLEEAILRTVREVDKPKAFQVGAMDRFLDELQGRGLEGERSLRASVLGAEPGRLRDVAQRYLSPEQGRAGVLAGAGREAELDRLGLSWRRL